MTGHLSIFEAKLEWFFHEVAQSCETLCDLMDYSLPGSSIHDIFQARILGWVAISFSRGSSQPRDWTWVFGITGRLFTFWAIGYKVISKLIFFPFWLWFILEGRDPWPWYPGHPILSLCHSDAQEMLVEIPAPSQEEGTGGVSLGSPTSFQPFAFL